MQASSTGKRIDLTDRTDRAIEVLDMAGTEVQEEKSAGRD
jgi:hypothetical protein